MGILKKKDVEAMDFQKGVTIAEQRRPGAPLTEDYVNSLGRSVYSIIDPEVISEVTKRGSKLKWIVPAISHLNRMTNLSKTDVEILKLDLDALFYEYEALREEGEYDTKEALLTSALQIFSNIIPADSFQGFKAKLLAYQMKVIRTELEEKKTKGIL